MKSLPFVSVIVPTYGREQVLCETLLGVLEQRYPRYEVLVVDQTARHLPATDQCLRTLVSGGKIRHFLLSKPSLPAARNFGARQAKGEIILYIDDDVQPCRQLIEAHAREYGNPEVGGVAGGRSYPEYVNISEAVEPVGVIARNSDHISNFSSSRRFEAVEWASGCNMSFRKGLIEQIDGFDTRFIGSAAYEDVDFCFRLRGTGYRIVFSPEAHLVHLIEPDGGCGNRLHDMRYYRGFIHNSLLFACKNLPPRQRALVAWDRMLMSGALVRQRRDLRFLSLFIEALARSTLACVSDASLPLPVFPLRQKR